MKKFPFIFTLIILLFGLQQSFASTKTIPDYATLKTTLAAGTHVRAIMLFNKCTPATNSIGGIDFNTFNTYMTQVDNQPKEVIATSINMLFQHSKYGPLYNYVRLRITDDSNIEILSQYLDPRTYAVTETITYQCKLNEGVMFYGVD